MEVLTVVFESSYLIPKKFYFCLWCQGYRILIMIFKITEINNYKWQQF